MALEGNDPRTWDLRQLCAAFEYQVRIGCKDDAEWSRERTKLYAPPKGAADPFARRGAAVPPGTPGAGARLKPQPMDAGGASAFLASLSAEDRTYGAL